MTVTYNPGEPLFDQDTRDFVEVDGDVVMAEDDDEQAIMNAVWYRTMTQKGDCPRDRDAGIDRGMELFNPEFPVSAGLGSVRQEIIDTPGVTSVQDITIVDYDATLRTLRLAYTVDTVGGGSFTNTSTLSE